MFSHSLRRIPLILSAILLLFGAAINCQAQGPNDNEEVGAPAGVPPDYVPAPALPPQPPAYAEPAPAPPPQFMLPPTPPQFVFVPDLGYYVAVGTPYDIAYIGNAYFAYRGGFWYRSAYYGGPLLRVEAGLLPPLLLRYNIRDFRHFRNIEFRRYNHDRAHYRGRVYRPGGRRAGRREGR